MPYQFLEELATADIAFRAWGVDLEELFVACADATANVMVEELQSIEPRERRALACENEALDLLLFDFLQELIYYKDAEQLLLRVPEAEIQKDSGQWKLKAVARGEKLDPKRHRQRVDVKAVTLHRFQLEQTRDGWQAQVILDI